MIMLVRKLLKYSISTISLSFLIPFVSAQRNMNFNIGDAFDLVFGRQGLWGILKSRYGVYGLTIIFYYLLFYSIYTAGLKKVKMFEGEGGLGVNTSGKLLANAFTGLSILGIFAFVDPTKDNLFSLFSVFGWYGQLILMIVMFFLIRSWFKDTGWSNMMKWGVTLLITGIFLMLVGGYVA